MMISRDPTGDTFRASGGTGDGDGAGDVEEQPRGGASQARPPRETAKSHFRVAQAERLIRVYAGAGQVVFAGRLRPDTNVPIQAERTANVQH